MPDNKVKLPKSHRFLVDGFQYSKRAGGYGVILTDMTQVLDFKAYYKQKHGYSLSPTVMALKASALALEKYPETKAFLQKYTKHYADTVDIGVSVKGKTNFAPLAVIRDTLNKDFTTLSEDLKVESQKLLDEEDERLKKLETGAKLFFMRRVRKRLIELSQNNFNFVRSQVGIFQISNIGAIGVDYALSSHIATTGLLIMGALKDRPLVVDGEIVIRPSMYLTMQFDHRPIDGMMAGLLLMEIHRLMETIGRWGSDYEPGEK